MDQQNLSPTGHATPGQPLPPRKKKSRVGGVTAVLLILLAVIAFSLLYSLVISPAQQQKRLDECLTTPRGFIGTRFLDPDEERAKCFERYPPR